MRNFDKTAAWQVELEAGADAPEFETLEVIRQLEFSVADKQLLQHIAPGLVWQTAMYCRDDD